MVSSKVSSRKPSKTSSLAAPSTSASTQTSSKSSILQSLFSPPELPGCYYASVIQGIDSQHLRIHDATSGQLRCDHAIETRGTVNSLDWGYYGQNNDDRQHAEHRRKRKRAESKHGEDPNRWTGKVVLAFGTSDSYVQFLSIDGEIVGTLNGEHRLGVRDFKFDNIGRSGKGWSIGGDSKIVQWSLHDGRCIKSNL